MLLFSNTGCFEIVNSLVFPILKSHFSYAYLYTWFDLIWLGTQKKKKQNKTKQNKTNKNKKTKNKKQNKTKKHRGYIDEYI